MSSVATEDPFKAVSTENLKSASVKAEDGNTTTASDFQEDPFKNYRYEDPFLIEDPFKDENGNQQKANETIGEHFLKKKNVLKYENQIKF